MRAFQVFPDIALSFRTDAGSFGLGNFGDWEGRASPIPKQTRARRLTTARDRIDARSDFRYPGYEVAEMHLEVTRRQPLGDLDRGRDVTVEIDVAVKSSNVLRTNL